MSEPDKKEWAVIKDWYLKEIYWTGEIMEGGTPCTTEELGSARLFHTAREAYAEAGQYRKLWTFRVGKRIGLDAA